jgi:cellulose synthase operon protein C
MNTRDPRYLAFVAALALALAGLAGCSKNDASGFMASAQGYMAKGNYPAAIIEIKNALQKEPENGEARLMLATALLETGDAGGAEQEVRKAMAAKVSDDLTYPILARALGQQREYKKLSAEVAGHKLTTPAARSAVGLVLALAAAAQGDIKSAKALTEGVLAEQPGNAPAMLLQAQLVAGGGDLPGARKIVAQVLKNSPDNLDAMMLQAQFDIASGNVDEAQKQFERAIAAHPDAVAPRAELVSLAIGQQKADLAKPQLAKLKEIAPKDVRTVYADALVSAATGDNQHAHEAIERVLAARPDHMPSVFLSGLIDFQLGSNASAEAALRRVLARVPDDPNSARILALVLLRGGRANEAIEALGPALRRLPDNPQLLRTAGEAYLASGNLRQATSSYERANALDKSNVGSQVRLAQVRLAAGDTGRGFGDLETLASSNASQYQADLALIAEHLRLRQYDKALAAVDALEKKQPKAAFVQSVRGGIYLAKRDLPKARQSFEKALELQPDFYNAAYSLAVIDIQEGRPQAAQERFNRMLEKYPKNEQLLLASSELLALTGGTPDQVKAAIEKSIQANPTSPRSRLALINVNIRQRDPKAAVAAAQAGLSAIPNDPGLLEALGASQLAAGDRNQAVDTFRKLVDAQPQNPLVYLRLADAQLAVGNYGPAADNVRKALALKPDLPQASTALAKISLAAGKPEDALAEARKLQKAQPNKATGYTLEGAILSAQRKWPEAAGAFQSALLREQSPGVAVALYGALQNAGKGPEATAMATKWIKDNPKDATMPLLLAEQAQRRNDAAVALAGYEKVIEIDADNVVALNNAAWILSEQKNPKAIDYAERAHRLAPFNAGVLDTLGWALTRSGDARRGVQLLRMASSLSPEAGEIRLHLGRALADSGDKGGARKELGELTKLDKDSPVRVEAEKLLATL